MPSTGMHLYLGNKLAPHAADLFWVGCFAPDYPNDRSEKDEVHFRLYYDRMAALEDLRDKINLANPFEFGWLLHLFADYYWDKNCIPEYKNFFCKNNNIDDWFLPYRKEIGIASYYLYHNLQWSKEVWNKVKNADLKNVNTILPISPFDNERYRDHVVKKHEESDKKSNPEFFTIDRINDFAVDTIAKFKKWIHTK